MFTPSADGEPINLRLGSGPSPKCCRSRSISVLWKHRRWAALMPRRRARRSTPLPGVGRRTHDRTDRDATAGCAARRDFNDGDRSFTAGGFVQRTGVRATWRHVSENGDNPSVAIEPHEVEREMHPGHPDRMSAGYVRAISTDIMHVPARVVVTPDTPADAPHRPQGLKGASERPMIIPHDYYAPSATTL